MKKLFFLLSIIASIFLVNSCTEEDDNNTDVCANVICLNGGTCVDGSCDCPANYSGDSCQTYTGTSWPTAPFVGDYTGSNSCDVSGAVLNVTDSASVPNRLYFDGGTNDTIADYYGDLNSATTFTIPSQQPRNTLNPNPPFLSGSGSISGNTLTMTYTLAGYPPCNFVLTK